MTLLFHRLRDAVEKEFLTFFGSPGTTRTQKTLKLWRINRRGSPS